MLPQGRLLGVGPRTLEFGRRNNLGPGKKLRPFWLSTKSQSEQHSKVVTPMVAIVPKNFTTLVNIDLSLCHPIITHFDKPSELSPSRCDEVTMSFTPWSFEVEHL